MTKIDEVIIDIENPLNLPLKETESANHLFKQRDHSKKHSFSLLNKSKKRQREYDEADSDDLPQSNKRRAKGKSIEYLLERITLNGSVSPEKRTVKVFSDGILPSTSSLLLNLYKNYYPSLIPPYYSSQVRQCIVANQLNKVSVKLNAYRRQVLDKKRMSLINSENGGAMHHVNTFTTGDKCTMKEIELDIKWSELERDEDFRVEEGDDDNNEDDDSNAENNPNMSYPNTENSQENSFEERREEVYEDEVQEDEDIDHNTNDYDDISIDND